MGRDRVIQDTRQLVAKAFSIIDAEGFEHFSARKLAEVLGISHMTVYNYIGRDELLNEVIVMGFDALYEGILPHVEACKVDGSNPCCLFLHIAEELLKFAQEHRNIYRFMFQNSIGLQSDNQRVRQLYSSGIELIKESLPTERREILQTDVYLFMVLINGLILGYLGQRHSTTEAECRANMTRAYELLLGLHCSRITPVRE